MGGMCPPRTPRSTPCPAISGLWGVQAPCSMSSLGRALPLVHYGLVSAGALLPGLPNCRLVNRAPQQCHHLRYVREGWRGRRLASICLAGSAWE